jgi:hypothetical protein
MLCALDVTSFPIFLCAHVKQSRGATADFMPGVVRRDFSDVFLRFGNELFESVWLRHRVFVRPTFDRVELDETTKAKSACCIRVLTLRA